VTTTVELTHIEAHALRRLLTVLSAVLDLSEGEAERLHLTALQERLAQ
jgi:hypothetical protein